MNVIYTNEAASIITKIVLAFAVTLISYYLIPYLKTKTYTETHERLLNVVESSVKAYEQTIGSGNGKLKKSSVVEFVNKWLTANGIYVSNDELDVLIEAMVFKMKGENYGGAVKN